MQAAFKGMREIFGSVVAMTIMHAGVFTPLAFTGGLTGSLFREFAVPIGGIISGFIAVTVTLMVSARLLKASNYSRFAQLVDGTFEHIANRYEHLVVGSLNYRLVTLLIVVVLVSVTGFMFFKISTELAPEVGSGALFSLTTAPLYATTEYTSLYADQIRALTKDLSELKANFYIVGMGGDTNSGFSVWAFKDWAERERS